MPTSFGTSPLGMTPFGFSTASEGPAPPNRRLLAPFLDPASKRFSVNDDGELNAMPVNRQRVLVTCLTTVGSSTTLPGFGISLPQKLGDSFDEDAKAAVRAGLQYMVDDGSITVDRVTVTRRPNGQPEVNIEYTDLQRGGVTDEATIYV